MKVVYIGGPFRGKSHWDVHCNVHRASQLALDVWRLGAAVICPQANTAFFQDAAPDDVWLSGYLELLQRCDALLLTPDWQRSQGAQTEQQHAIKIGIPVFYTLDEVRTWLNLSPHLWQTDALTV